MRVAAIATLPAIIATPAASSKSDKQRARDLLRGHLYDRFTETGVLGETLDQKLYLCSDGMFIYDTVSFLPDPGTTTTTHATGRWRVISAHFGHGTARARVRGVPDGAGQPTTVTFIRDRRGQVTIDGNLVTVEANDKCN